MTKYLQMDVDCCDRCPFMEMDDYGRPGYTWWCGHDDAPEGKGHVLDDHPRDKCVTKWCPLPDKKDWIEGHKIGGGT